MLLRMAPLQLAVAVMTILASGVVAAQVANRTSSPAPPADDLGVALWFDTTLPSPRAQLRVVRDPKAAESWRHIEWNHSRPAGLPSGMSVASLPIDVTARVAASWPDGATATGRILVESDWLTQRCVFDGAIAADRTRLSGTVQCGADHGNFHGVIDRGVSCKTFDGIWIWQLGRMVVRQTGELVTATFDGGGTLRATLRSSSNLDGEWRTAGDHGRISLQHSEGDATLQAWMTTASDSKVRTFTGVCVGPRPR